MEKSADLQSLLDFFEGLDELILMTDEDSHELLFLNRKLREWLGLQSHKAYAGQSFRDFFHMENVAAEGGDLGCFAEVLRADPSFSKNPIVKSSRFSVQDRHLLVMIALNGQGGLRFDAQACVARSETILNECLQRLFAAADPDAAMEIMIGYLGETFHCDRVDIFELDEQQKVSNTYEWCSHGVSSRQGALQNLSAADIDFWLKSFKTKNTNVIENIEALRRENPSAYSLLKPREVRNIVTGAIRDEGKLCGFLCAENADPKMFPVLVPILNVLGYFIASQLKRGELYRRLNELSFRDMLTGAYNRNALYSHSSGFREMRNLGVIYCDITGLKTINDTCGHHVGDEAICRCYGLIQKTLNTMWIYRTGGDEFIAIYPNVGEPTLLKEEQRLRQAVMEGAQHIAVGSAWSNQHPMDLVALFAQADGRMYQDKEDYYTNSWICGGRDRRQSQRGERELLTEPKGNSPLDRFLAATYHDMRAFLTSLAQDNYSSYFFFGDVQKDLYYISDNMRDKFGFPQNVVPSLCQVWTQRICSQQDRERYQQDLDRLMREKGRIHDVRYQVRDNEGQIIWIRCYGIMEWDAKREKPIFFSGRLTQQNERFVIDSVTNFPKEPVMIQHLDRLEKGDPCWAIGFCLNNIYEINATQGRAQADHLIRDIAEALEQQLGDRLSFYRLDGMRCAAMLSKHCADRVEDLIHEIRKIIREHYLRLGITVCYPCSFAVMEFHPGKTVPTDFVADMVSLIRVARHEPGTAYVDDSDGSLKEMEEMSSIALALGRDVMNGMENFRVVVQPLVKAENEKMVGGEVLLRWRLEDRDLPPSVFIPILEQENLMPTVGRWVLDQAVRTCVRMLAYAPEFTLSVNVSRLQLSDPGFGPFVQETLEKYGLEGRHLVLEMTESCMDGQQERLEHFNTLCQRSGIQVALDDFGSGYSSFRVLMQCPCRVIKLDRSLLLEMEDSQEKMNFVASIVCACHRFGKLVCIEGVETERQRDMAKLAKCDLIQGFFYYRPMEEDQVYQLLSEADAGGGGEWGDQEE